MQSRLRRSWYGGAETWSNGVGARRLRGRNQYGDGQEEVYPELLCLIISTVVGIFIMDFRCHSHRDKLIPSQLSLLLEHENSQTLSIRTRVTTKSVDGFAIS